MPHLAAASQMTLYFCDLRGEFFLSRHSTVSFNLYFVWIYDHFDFVSSAEHTLLKCISLGGPNFTVLLKTYRK